MLIKLSNFAVNKILQKQTGIARKDKTSHANAKYLFMTLKRGSCLFIQTAQRKSIWYVDLNGWLYSKRHVKIYPSTLSVVISHRLCLFAFLTIGRCGVGNEAGQLLCPRLWF